MPLMPVEDALRRILRGVKPLAAEAVPLEDSLGRVLAKPLTAKRDQPPFDASAMDGYAVIAADVAAAPATLAVLGVSAAGHGFKARLRPGQCVRIFTGAPLPQGSDTLVIRENVKVPAGVQAD
jgi:molybdopterin molybdotransferase